MTNYQNNSQEHTILAENLVRERIQGTRKGLPDEPNFRHSFRVQQIVSEHALGLENNDDLLIAALLHDIVEDGGVSFDELGRMGFTPRTIELIRLCSHDTSIKDKTERWLKMILRLAEANDEDAWRIKLADLADNLTQSAGLLLENRTFMIEAKVPILLRLAHVQNSAYFLLKDEADKQKKELAKIAVGTQETKDEIFEQLAENTKKPMQCLLWKKEYVNDDDLHFSGFDLLYTFYDDGHLSRRLIRCKECGQLYLKEFYEEIDWVDGDDPQYVTYIPVSDEQEAWLINKADIFQIQSFFPKLRIDHPKGKLKTIQWVGRDR